MKQILHTTNFGEAELKEPKKSITIYILEILIVLILIIAVIVVFSINIQAMTQEENTDNQNRIENYGEVANIEQEEEKLVVVNKDNIEEKTESTTISETNKGTEKQDSQTIAYTAPNGEQYTIIGALNIPTLGIEYPILSSTSTALLKISLNKYWGANPNEVGNMCVVGHNYRNTKFFSKLLNINIGDIVKVTDGSGRTLDYTVYSTYTVDPNDTSCTSQLTNGHTEITLITCCNNNTERFVVKARAN